MDKKIIIKYREEPAWEVIGGGITEYNTKMAGDDQGKNLCFVLENPDGEVLGGVIGMTYWNWLYISLMWLPEDLRGKGYGHKLLEMA
ncbi:MAG: GNAT family N-acetyltransferase [Brevefilum sp.]|nr:GNAT family N-acetyltransferase [Brevefilum sp.]MDT8382144.1 GNAT family N-acetyltransferase [Brevefilum sp.]